MKKHLERLLGRQQEKRSSDLFVQRGESSPRRSIKAKQTSPFLCRNRLVWHRLHLCSFPSVTPGFQTVFGHYVPPPQQHKSVVRVKYRCINDWWRSDFPARPNRGSDIRPHLKRLVTVANWCDWRIICLCFNTEASWSDGLLVKTTKGSWGGSQSIPGSTFPTVSPSLAFITPGEVFYVV